jgi:hypothetical protein
VLNDEERTCRWALINIDGMTDAGVSEFPDTVEGRVRLEPWPEFRTGGCVRMAQDGREIVHRILLND